MNRPAFLLLIFSLCCSLDVAGYEVDTHGAITKHVYDRSQKLSGAGSTLLSDLGVDGWGKPANSDEPIGAVYYDLAEDTVEQREIIANYEGEKIEKLGIATTSIQGWLMRGAIREDDVKGGGLCNVGETPPMNDDPYPSIPDRPINHFYDPINNRGLNQVVVNGEKATDWALGVNDALIEPPVEDSSCRDHFTLLDALEAQYRALTGRKSSDPADQNYPVVANAEQIGPGGAVATKAIRDAYWATMLHQMRVV